MMGLPAAISRRTADWRFTVGVVSGGHFLSHFYNIAFPPLFPLLRAEFALNNTQLGLLVTAVALGSFLQLPMGVLVDRFGAKRMFLFAVGTTSLGVILTGAGTTYHVLLAFALVAGIGQSAFHPADYALLDAATRGDNEGKSFGVHTFGGYAGFAVGPLVFGGIGFAYGWRVALVAAGAVGLAYVLFAAVTLDPVHRRTIDSGRSGSESVGDVGLSDLRRMAADLLQPMILALTGFFALRAMAMAGIKSFAPVLSIDVFGMLESTANVTLTAFFAAAAVSVLAGGFLADRYSPHRLIVANTTVAALLTWGIVSGIVPGTPPVVVAFFALLGLFVGVINPARDRLVSSLSRSGSTGKSFGLAFTGGTVGGTLSPVVLGAVIDAGTPRLAFLLIGGVFLLGAIVVSAMGLTSARATPRPAD